MPRSDLLISLVQAQVAGDRWLFRKTLEAVIAEERAKQHHVLADRLAEFLNNGGDSEQPSSLLVRNGPSSDLFYELTPRRSLDDLVLPVPVLSACRELVEEQQRADILRSHNMEPRNKVLLAGPPGNGKTSLAEAIAQSLIVPLVAVRYEGVIGSFLGETASRLRKLFEHVHSRRCVLFLDEFDTLGKERGDPHDTGEIKRVVSSLLLQIDDLPSHVVIITATNHPELLDRAVWRRFQLRLYLPMPTRTQVQEWFDRLGHRLNMPLGYTARTLSDNLAGASFAELEEFSMDIARRLILSVGTVDAKRIVSERLKHWHARFRLDHE